MQIVAITGERKAELVEVPRPRPVENWALVKVHTAPMCTEYKAWARGSIAMNLGHEAVGEVVEVAQPGRVRVGDRVVVMPQFPCGECALCVAGDYIHCEHVVDFQAFTGSASGRGTYGQYLLKPDWILPRIPDDVSYDMASLALCALGPTLGALERMNVNAFDTVMITGLGPVGLGGVVNATYRGARVIAVDSIPYRQQLAKELGAEVVLDPRQDATARETIAEITQGLGVDAAVDCSGNIHAERFCIDMVRRRGQVTYVGECNDPLEITISPDMIRKGISLHGSWHYNLSFYPKVMQVIQRSPVAHKLITHTFPMSRVQQAFEVSASHGCAKILLHPWE